MEALEKNAKKKKSNRFFGIAMIQQNVSISVKQDAFIRVELPGSTYYFILLAKKRKQNFKFIVKGDFE